MVDFVVERTPHQDRTLLRSDLNQLSARSLMAFLAYDHAGQFAGVSYARTSTNLLESSAFVTVSTRVDLAGQGLGSRLFAAMLADVELDVNQLVTCVLADDHASLAVARHWGFEEVQCSITSSVVLTDTGMPDPAAGITFQPCDDLTFDDPATVDAMLLASQTNPEFDLGLALNLDSFREIAAPGQIPIAVVTRVDGRPAAISFAVADDDQMHVVYTGVDPEFRGRRLAFFTKTVLHSRAHGLGIRMALTDNDESNQGIRRVNDELGYSPHSSWTWMMRPWP